MIDIENIKIGDKVNVIDNSDIFLKLHKSYEIQEIIPFDDIDAYFHFIILKNDEHIYSIDRFILDLKSIRKNKLSKILYNA
jgi:hypothetical protein